MAQHTAQVARDVVDFVREEQNRLLWRERKITRQILEYYTRLYREARDVLRTGDEKRIRAFREAIARRLAKLALDTQEDILKEVDATLQRSAEKQLELLQQVTGNNVKVTLDFDRLDTPAAEAMHAMTRPDSPVYRRFVQTVGERPAQEIASILDDYMAAGENPMEAARAIRKTLATSMTWAVTHARTTMLWASRLGTLLTYQQNSDVVAGWQWLAYLDERTCPACRARHGKIYRLSEPLRGHYQCRCTMVPVVDPELADELGLPVPGVEPGVNSLIGMSISQQQRALGPATWLAWQQGRISLDELYTEVVDPVYGRMTVRRPLKDLVGERAAKELVQNWRWLQKHPPRAIRDGAVFTEWIEKRFGVQAVGFQRAHPDAVQGIVRELQALGREHPFPLAENFHMLEVADLPEDVLGQAVVHAGIVRLNRRLVVGTTDELKTYASRVRRSMDRRFIAPFPWDEARPHVSAVRTVVRHEMGHLLDGWLQHDAATVPSGLDAGLRELALLRRLLIAELYDKVGIPSSYANTSSYELLAEWFVLAKSDRRARRLFKKYARSLPKPDVSDTKILAAYQKSLEASLKLAREEIFELSAIYDQAVQFTQERR